MCSLRSLNSHNNLKEAICSSQPLSSTTTASIGKQWYLASLCTNVISTVQMTPTKWKSLLSLILHLCIHWRRSSGLTFLMNLPFQILWKRMTPRFSNLVDLHQQITRCWVWWSTPKSSWCYGSSNWWPTWSTKTQWQCSCISRISRSHWGSCKRGR